MTDSNPSLPRLNLRAFLLLQLLFLVVAVGAFAFRADSVHGERRLPELRNTPLQVGPLQDEPLVVTDQQLQSVLLKLRPRDLGSKTKINHTDHALRFWGLEAAFGDSNYMDGSEMQRRLMDHRRFVELYGDGATSLLVDDASGVRVNVQLGETTSSHEDHTMACLAEVGTPLDHPLITPGQTTVFRAMVEQSLRDFSLNQLEYEWSVLTFALYMPPQRQWMTRDGQFVSFDMLARRIMRQPMPQGTCFGNHRLHTLAMLLRLQRQEAARDLLSPDVITEIRTYLSEMTRRLVKHQHTAGYWDGNWYSAEAGSQPLQQDPNLLRDRVLATGHALEWWGTLDPQLDHELLPPRSNVVSAGQWLVHTIEELPADETLEMYTYLTHAGRALTLWRRLEPASLLQP